MAFSWRVTRGPLVAADGSAATQREAEAAALERGGRIYVESNELVRAYVFRDHRVIRTWCWSPSRL